MRHGPVIFLGVLLASASALGQGQSEAPAVATDRAVPLIDSSTIASPRAEAMGGALAPFADDLDAFYHNPAGIGGRNWEKRKVPFIRKLYFPAIHSTSNKNATQLNQDFKDQDGARDRTVGEAIIDAHAGKRQYARVGGVLGMVFGRLGVLPFYDAQIAAVSHGSGTNLIDTLYRETSGLMFGTSVADQGGRYSIGYSGTLLTIKETRGDFLYDDMIDKARRSEAIAENSQSYSALAHNLGTTVRLAKKAQPSISLVARNFGGTKMATNTAGEEALTIDQDLTLAFSVSPELGKSNIFNFALQGDRLTDNDVTLAKKYRLGIEWQSGLGKGTGSYATLATRAGFSDAGAAYGFALNLGLLGFDISKAAVDLGSDNVREVEERYTATFYVNVADF